ncbi:MAG: DUF3021 domain-containing protein [Eubacterium sp.]
MLKSMIKAGFISIAAAALVFCLVGMVFDLTNGGSFTLSGYQFTKMFIGAAVVGLGFSIPSFIYKKDTLPYPIQIIFHMGIGCAVLLIVGFTVGWIPVRAGAASVILTIAGELLTAFILWKCFEMHYRKEAEQINRRLQERGK